MTDLTRAREIIKGISAEINRWGKHANVLASCTTEELQEALVAIGESGLLDISEDAESQLQELKAQLAKANRQTGAAKSRETKYKNKVEFAEAEIATLIEHNDNLEDELSRVRLQLKVATGEKKVISPE